MARFSGQAVVGLNQVCHLAFGKVSREIAFVGGSDMNARIRGPMFGSGGVANRAFPCAPRRDRGAYAAVFRPFFHGSFGFPTKCCGPLGKSRNFGRMYGLIG